MTTRFSTAGRCATPDRLRCPDDQLPTLLAGVNHPQHVVLGLPVVQIAVGAPGRPAARRWRRPAPCGRHQATSGRRPAPRRRARPIRRPPSGRRARSPRSIRGTATSANAFASHRPDVLPRRPRSMWRSQPVVGPTLLEEEMPAVRRPRVRIQPIRALEQHVGSPLPSAGIGEQPPCAVLLARRP